MSVAFGRVRTPAGILAGLVAAVPTAGCRETCEESLIRDGERFEQGDRCLLLIAPEGGLVEIIPNEVILRPQTEPDPVEGGAETGALEQERAPQQELVVRGFLHGMAIPADGYTVMIEATDRSGSSDDTESESNPGEHLALGEVAGGGCEHLSDLLLRCRLDADGIAKFAVFPREPAAHDLYLKATSGDPSCGPDESCSTRVEVSYGLNSGSARFVIDGGQCSETIDSETSDFTCTVPPLLLDDGEGGGFCGPQAPACSEILQSVDGYFRLEEEGASISKPYDIDAVLNLSSASSDAWFLAAEGERSCDLSSNIRSATFTDTLPRDAFNSRGASLCIPGSDETVKFDVEVALAGGEEQPSRSGTTVETKVQLGGMSLVRIGTCEEGEATCYSLDVWTCWGTIDQLLQLRSVQTLKELITVRHDGNPVPADDEGWSEVDRVDSPEPGADADTGDGSHRLYTIVVLDEDDTGSTPPPVDAAAGQLHRLEIKIDQRQCTHEM